MPLDFRLSAWPQGGDHYVTTYNTDRYMIDVKMILDYVESELRRIAPAFVFKTTFTLVNVTSKFTEMSVGLCDSPDESLRRGPLTFTFARTKDNNGAQEPDVTIWHTMYSATWGPATNHMADFITVNVPLVVCTRARVQQMMEKTQRLLFNIAGGFTKAVIRSIHDANLNYSGMEKFKYYQIPRAMFYVSLNDWKYVLDFWKRMPDLLRVTWDSQFLEYYCREIAPNLPQRQRSPYYEQYREEAIDALRGFVLDYLQNTVKPAEINLLSLLPADDMIINDVETLVSNLAQGKIE